MSFPMNPQIPLHTNVLQHPARRRSSMPNISEILVCRIMNRFGSYRFTACLSTDKHRQLLTAKFQTVCSGWVLIWLAGAGFDISVWVRCKRYWHRNRYPAKDCTVWLTRLISDKCAAFSGLVLATLLFPSHLMQPASGEFLRQFSISSPEFLRCFRFQYRTGIYTGSGSRDTVSGKCCIFCKRNNCHLCFKWGDNW